MSDLQLAANSGSSRANPSEVLGSGPSVAHRGWSSRYACASTGLFALVVLFGEIVFARGPLTFDEPWYLNTVSLLDEHGLSVRFLQEYPGTAGPTFAFMHYLFRPLTRLQPPAVRLVSYLLLLLLLLGVICSTLRWLRRNSPLTSSHDRPLEENALDIIGVPMIWVVAGMALTEMPAMLLASMSVLLLLHTQRRGKLSWVFAVLGGLALSLAILGRQPYLALLAAAPILMGGRRGSWLKVATYIAAGAALPTVVFTIWGGPVPRAWASETSGIAVGHGLLSLAYAGLVSLLLAPGYLKLPWKVAALIFAGLVVFNSIFQWVTVSPMRTAVKMLLAESWQVYYTLAVSGVLAGFAGVFLAAFVSRIWEHRADRYYVFLSIATLLLLAASSKVTTQFSSRYTVLATPIYILVLAYHSRPGAWKTAGVALGSLLGGVILWTYIE